MPKKRNVKKILIIAAILFIVILVVRELVIEAIERANQEDKVYTEISDFSNIKEIAEYMGCTYIKEEESTGERYDVDIYLKFKYPLYTEEVSNEEYYYRIIALVTAYYNYQNIRLIDQENDIVIAVTCDRENQVITNLLINGEENYFGKTDTENILENYENFQVISMEAESTILKQLIEAGWDEKKVNFGTQESTYDNYKIYFDEGIKIKIVGGKVFHLVFTDKYTENIINGINVNTDEQTITTILGEPELRIETLGVLGYRGENFYIFFNTKEKSVGIYRRQTITEEEKETLERMLIQLSVDGNAMVFASDMTDMWSDYDIFEYTDGYIKLQYTLRGMAFEVNVTENNGLMLYKNYNGSLIRDLKNGEEIPYIYLSDTDLIYEYEKTYEITENTRKKLYQLQLDQEIVDNSKNSSKFYVLDVSDSTAYKELMFISIDDTHYSFDFETVVNSYVWLDDYNFAYSIKNQGIYRYNILTEETYIILEGQDEFNLIEYTNGHLKYDDKEIMYVVQ